MKGGIQMRKFIIVALLLSICVTAHAKKLEEVTAKDVSSFAGSLVFNSVKYTLKALAVPFYWLEKVAK